MFSDAGSRTIEQIVIEEDTLPDYVGQPPFARDRIYDTTPSGVVMGLAWSSQGGNSLYIEAASVERSEGKGSLKSTGTSLHKCLSDQKSELALLYFPN